MRLGKTILTGMVGTAIAFGSVAGASAQSVRASASIPSKANMSAAALTQGRTGAPLEEASNVVPLFLILLAVLVVATATVVVVADSKSP